MPQDSTKAISYDTLPGYFIQDEGLGTKIPAIPTRFGLLDNSLERWARFIAHIKQLTDIQDRNTKHKVIFFGRHGEGFYNVGEAKYGTEAWDSYWSKKTGDGEITWGPNPELTAIGVGQAVTVNQAWKAEIEFGIPIPEKLYTSPLTRAMKTCEVTFKGILLDDKRRTVVVEGSNCREENGVHTCDKRRTKSYIQKSFPLFDIEPGFEEDDILWDENTRKTKASLAERAAKVLDAIFENDNETFISITAHGGIINGFLKCLGQSPYYLPTGGVLPIVVRASYSS